MRNLLGGWIVLIIGGFITLVIVMTALKMAGNPLDLIPITFGK